MASATSVGDVTQVQLLTVDSFGEQVSTTISKIKLKASADYGSVDSSSRAIIELSRNTYSDTDLITKISVNAQMST